MKRIVLFCLCVCVVALASGCVAPNPAALPVTPRDKQVYQDTGAQRQQKSEKIRIAVNVSKDDYEVRRPLAETLDASLTSGLADLNFFEVVERAQLSALIKEQRLAQAGTSGADAIPPIDFMISAKINAIRQTPSVLKGLSDLSVSVDFRLTDVASKRPLVVKNIEKSYTAVDSSQISVAVQECARNFIRELGARYAPPARVLETRGEGKVAKISIGRNAGAIKDSRVEFFEWADYSDVHEGLEKEPFLVGYGVVLHADGTTAWVKVDNYKTAQVKRGHYVKLMLHQENADGGRSMTRVAATTGAVGSGSGRLPCVGMFFPF